MFISINRDDFLDGLAKVVPIAEKRSTLPILSHVLMEAKAGELFMTATDLEVGLKTRNQCTVNSEGSITVPSRKILEIVRELPSGQVDVQLTETGRIKVVSGLGVFELAGLDPFDYPAWSSFEDVEKTPVNADQLTDMIEKTIFASSVDDSRYNLNGILFEQAEEKISMVATDGHRFAMITRDIGFRLPEKALAPRKGLHEIKRILENVEGDVLLGFEPKNMIVGTDRFTMTVRLIDGDFPNYKEVVPESQEKVFRMDRMALLHGLKRVGVLTSDRNKGIEIIVKPGSLEMTCTHPDLGTGRDVVETQFDGEQFDFSVNVAYFIEALSVLDTERVCLEYEAEESPLIVRPDPPKDYFNLVMPMRK